MLGQNSDSQWALSRISVAHMRTKPGHSSEISSQVIMGMPIKLIEKDGDWWRVETPDGYQGYIIDNSLVIMDSLKLNAWKDSKRVVVTSMHQTYVYESKDKISNRNIITDVVNGVILEGEKTNEAYTKVTLPDGLLKNSILT